MIDKDLKLAVIGLGYVGLPLALEFSNVFKTVGFDINRSRVAELRDGKDFTNEITKERFAAAKNIKFTADVNALDSIDVFIVTVPTPVDIYNKPDLGPLLSASELVAKKMLRGSTTIFESTVFPGATENYCVPILESVSGLMLNKDFYVGYSPERINPGDTERTVSQILKVTSGSNDEAARFVDELYKTVITAGTFCASSIKVAEAAKVIENTQRDVNIALMNELSLIFDRIGISTRDVLQAASTKWNFLPFKPGLVGGHCIGVDPYYLAYEAEAQGYKPELVLAGRRINNSMAAHCASLLVKKMAANGVYDAKAAVLVLGLTFKEDCPDIRNSKVFDLVRELAAFGLQVDVHDPNIESEIAIAGGCMQGDPSADRYAAVVLAVPHACFVARGVASIRKFGIKNHVFFDLKSVFSPRESDLTL